MFCISICWLVCTLVTVAIATNSSGEHFIDFISELSTAEPALKFTTSTGVGLGAGEGVVAAGDARLVAHSSPEPPAHTSSTVPAGSWTSPYPATQPYSNHSDRQTPDTAVPTTAASTITETDDDHISFLRRLSPEEKNSRLVAAAQQGAVWELEALLAAGADAGAEDSLQGTPLHYAARSGHAAVVRLLLAAGADHTATTVGNGWTPLHVAAWKGHTEAAAALLEGGASRGARDSRGRTPLDIARGYDKQQVVELLQRDGGLTTNITTQSVSGVTYE